MKTIAYDAERFTNQGEYSETNSAGGLRAWDAKYAEHGIKTTRGGRRSKRALDEGWNEDDYEHSEFGDGDNIGIKTGSVSGGLVDVEGDSPEGLATLRLVLPPTLRSGRAGSPGSHNWFRSAGTKTEKFKDLGGGMMIEIRADGCQTMVEPSIHPSGEPYSWAGGFDISEVRSLDAAKLRGLVVEAATIALIAKYLPEGGRNDYALHWSGFLLRRLDTAKVEDLLHKAWRIKSADSGKAVDDITGMVELAATKLKDGENVTGGPRLEEEYPDLKGAPARVSKWWGWKGAKGSHVPTHDELRERYIEANPDVGYGMGEYRRYRDGIWVPEDELSVQRGVTGVLEAAKEEGVRPTQNLVNSVAGMVKVRTAVPDWLWDRGTGTLVLENGALDLSNRRLLPHNRSNYATQKLPYAYDAGAWPPIFDTFVRATLPDSWEFVQEFFGYCLTPDCGHETALWLYGVRGSGKSTLMEGLMAMLGHRYGRLGLSNIQNGRFGLANLPGKYVLGATEQPASYLAATDTLDAIISGEEVDVERKFKDVVTVRSTAKVVWAMNDLPRIGNTTSGTFRRVKVIEFPEPTRRDPRVKERIKGEGAGILNWSLVGFDRLKRRGHFDIPPSVVSATEEFQKDNDIPKLFVEDHCIVGTDRKGDPHKAQASELYDRYKKWCERHGHKPQSATRVAHDWQRLGFEKYQSKGKNYYRGLKLPLADTDSWGR